MASLSWTVANGQVNAPAGFGSQPTVAGDCAIDAVSLFGAPTMTVVSVAEPPAIELLLVVIV